MSDDEQRSASVDDAILGIPVDVNVVVGRCRPKLADLLALGTDAVLVLDSGINDPVEIYVGERLIARGELQEAGSPENPRLAVRISSLPSGGSDKT